MSVFSSTRALWGIVRINTAGVLTLKLYLKIVNLK